MKCQHAFEMQKRGLTYVYDCGQPALPCQFCGKAVCKEHARRVRNQIFCLMCACNVHLTVPGQR